MMSLKIYECNEMQSMSLVTPVVASRGCIDADRKRNELGPLSLHVHAYIKNECDK